MKESKPSIFRETAIARYTQSREESILPRFVSPRTIIYLWGLLGLFAFSAVASWFIKVPIYASGKVVVIDSKGKFSGIKGDVAALAFLPPEHVSKLHKGKQIFLRFDGINEPLGREIIAVESQVLSPQEVQKKFTLNPTITQPYTVAIAPLEPIPTSLPPSAYIGSIGRVDVEIGKERVISYLPLIGNLFK